MSRRGWQSGTLIKQGAWWRVRFRLDVPGVEARKHFNVKVAPVSLRLSRPELERRAAEIVSKAGANSVERFNRIVLNEGVTFREQAKIYLQEAVSRNRNPLRSTVSIEGALTKWCYPLIGNLPLNMVDNLSLKPLVRKMVAAGLSPRSVEKYTLYCKQVVASLKTPDGEPLYPRVWNAEVLDLPVVEFRKQKRPVLKVEGVNGLILSAKPGQMRVLFVLLAATGMRISEALALEAKHFIHEGKSVLIEQQVDKDCPRIINLLKTGASFREVDLHPAVAEYLRKYVSHKTGLIFQTKSGTPHLYHNLETRWLNPRLSTLGLDEKGMGWHSFKRFRNTWLRKQRVLEDYRMYWLAHKPKEMGEVYSALNEDLQARWDEAERCGYGFTLPDDVVPNVPRKIEPPVAKRKHRSSQNLRATRILVNRMTGTPKKS
jgi:integrase